MSYGSAVDFPSYRPRDRIIRNTPNRRAHRQYERVRCNEESSNVRWAYIRCDPRCAYDQFIFLMHWLISITKLESDGWLGVKNIERMEFTQNLPPIRGSYVHKNNFFHEGGSKILVEMCWRSPCAHRADILLSGK